MPSEHMRSTSLGSISEVWRVLYRNIKYDKEDKHNDRRCVYHGKINILADKILK